MVDATRMGRRDVSYDIGPFITLIDGPAFERVWEERQPLLLGQIHKADLVAVSRTDLLGAAQVKGILLTLKEYRNPVLMLSVRTGQGLEEVMQPIVTG
jgi:G3E family GTPase